MHPVVVGIWLTERIAIASYQEIVRWLGEGDVTTQRLMESILAVEEEHADDLFDVAEAPAERGGYDEESVQRARHDDSGLSAVEVDVHLIH